jgi:transcription-repair coupling factor (superfamily II helicase)
MQKNLPLPIPKFSIHNKIKPHYRFGNLFNASLIISNSALQHSGLSVVITNENNQNLIDEIKFYTANNIEILNFPDWETLPYDNFSPHQDIISTRLASLYRLPNVKKGILILPITTLMQRIAPLEYINKHTLSLKIGQKLDIQQISLLLKNNAYNKVNEVLEHGEFTIHNNLVDLFPMGSNQPYRIEIKQNKIIKIYNFDVESQLTTFNQQDITIFPAREFPANAIDIFKENWLKREFKENSTIFQDINNKLIPAGIEYYLPLFFKQQTVTLFDYLPKDSLILFQPEIFNSAENFWLEIKQRYEQLNLAHSILNPAELFLYINEIRHEIKKYITIELHQEQLSTAKNIYNLNVLALPKLISPNLDFLKNFLNDFNKKVLITVETKGRRESLLELLAVQKIKPKLLDNWEEFINSTDSIYLTIAPLEQGFLFDNIAIITENELFGKRVVQRRWREHGDNDAIVRDLTELAVNAPIVHEDYGIGRYLGLKTITVDDIATEFLYLEYANQAKLYVPVISLHLVTQFTGIDSENITLHNLGNEKWNKAKLKAEKQVHDVAIELLDIYAKRAAKVGYKFNLDQAEYYNFANSFPFEETRGQQDAIDSVLKDMKSTRPMDRLVCGDVGFGKTEVAMRAAFVAAQDGMQVAILVPTTLLAQQHYDNFLDRFADLPIKIQQLSRVRTTKEQNLVLKDLENGQIDIVIGTHKLLQKNIKFKRLALVIIDEEHRFGVKQKEQFKKLRAEVDLLALTATPIPRSLNMAMSALRDLSIIATPPAKRLAIRTSVSQWNNEIIQEAILRELKRGGQVYFLHNNIATISKIANEITKLVTQISGLKNVNIEIAHGQMPKHDLEHIMQDFYHRRFNILICTTIIESGIDVPNANTIIINRADKLGLAQLYQLRGRVGRSHHRAYAYLLTPEPKTMTKDAVRRLDAIMAMKDLGTGFKLAKNDLNIRGAGELLGKEQSGHMQEIGYDLYANLLENAVNSLKSGEIEQPILHGTEINLYTTALLPEDYIYDIHTRLVMYKRIANAKNQNVLNEIKVELIDRFGILPNATTALIKITELKLLATPLGISKIELGAKGGRLIFIDNPPIDIMQILNLVNSNPHVYKVDSKNVLHINIELKTFIKRLEHLQKLIKMLEE